jgi:hypothetical protein
MHFMLAYSRELFLTPPGHGIYTTQESWSQNRLLHVINFESDISWAELMFQREA